MNKVCFVATIPAPLRSFMSGYIRESAKDWSVKIISNPEGAELLSDLKAEFIPLSIERKPSPWRDLSALIQQIIIFRRERFDLIHSITPKAGLLSMLAGWVAGVPNRIHTFTGQVWATKHGWKRVVLKLFDRLIVLFASQVLLDSPSQRDFLISEGILPRGKGIVIGHGSICGVDSHRFCPDEKMKEAVRAELNISPGQAMILFLGRLNREKGILDIAAAFADIASKRSEVVLVLIGSEEDVSFENVQQICGEKHRERLRQVSFTTNPERYMAAADIFCLPSYREGFGQVIIEAGASGVPTVASHIYGITDAVDDGKTGLLFPVGDIAALTQALLELIDNQELRQRMGAMSRKRAIELFSNEMFTVELIRFYKSLLIRQ